MDSTQFTDQLVQFSGVEQQIRVNSQLETLIKSTNSSAGASLSGLSRPGGRHRFRRRTIHRRSDPLAPPTADRRRLDDRHRHRCSGQGALIPRRASSRPARTTSPGTVNPKGGTASVDKPYLGSVAAEDTAKKAITPVHSPLVARITALTSPMASPRSRRLPACSRSPTSSA